jgi:dTDP-4-dehydrorhamnose 3,5-epimerase
MMGKLKFIDTGFKGLYLIEPTVFGDERGFFLESYNSKEFEDVGLDVEFVQDNHSRSEKGVLRGMHFQKEHAQDKLIRVTSGTVYDVVVDLRKGSNTNGKWIGFELSAESKKMLFIPKGFAHGFLTLSELVDFQYKCSDFYYPEDECGIRWDDPKIGIKWPIEKIDGEFIISEKDKNWPYFEELNYLYNPKD